MKKYQLIIALCLLGLSAFAQDSTKVKQPNKDTIKIKQHNNEFGINATGFLRQFLNFNSSTTPPVEDNYYITYRRHFSCGNLRVAIGADFSNSNIPSPYTTDSNKYNNNSYSIHFIIGWEFYNNLSKKWQVFYGADFRPSIAYSKNDAQYWSGGYANGIETKTQIYGFGPFVGFRFKLSRRLSLLTSTSYIINSETDNNRTYYTPVGTVTGPAPTPTNQKTTKLYSSYSEPLAVFIDFAL
ncbi:MAG TPA: hypothetical protein VK806_07190 [Bacteroidia bacterium]|nr:hypothetical protein [Bacteroidia bacterium]